ncbi:MAG: hypothetical protein EPN23_00845 [Verrucomicrobia bacterium]|nr:MAG: hypothetical protein EPN23_00845 [Verrucomicrobiota bacterium]
MRSRIPMLKAVLMALSLLSSAEYCLAGVLNTVPVGLKTEMLTEPMGLDSARPRFSWRLETGRSGAAQKAYQVQVATSPEKLAKPDLWDSGWVESDRNAWVEYAGRELTSFQSLFWRVRLHEETGNETDWSQPARAEMGPLASKDWKNAVWLKAPAYPADTSASSEIFVRHAVALTDIQAKNRTETEALEFGRKSLRDLIHPLPLLRHSFNLAFEPVRARAYISAVGYADLRVNGELASDRVLDPAYTHYPVRRLYSTINLSGKLHQGANALGVSLGSGWAESFFMLLTDRLKNIHYGRPEFCLLVLVEDANGRQEWITTTGEWKCIEGPVRRSHYFLGEQFDARMLPCGWDKPGFDDSQWSKPELGVAFTGTLAAMQSPPERVIDSVRPKSVREPAPGVFVFELPDIVTGWVRLKVRNAKPGQTIVLRPVQTIFGEPWKDWTPVPKKHVLYYDDVEQPVAGLAGFDSPFEIISRKSGLMCAAAPLYTYTCKGGESETWTPRFTYHPFRYVEVTGYPGKPSLDDITAEIVRSDLAENGTCKLGDPELTYLRDVFLRTALYCCHGIIVDSAAIERGGYAAEAHGTLSLLRANRDMYQFVEKYLQDFKAQSTPKMPFFTAPSTIRGSDVSEMDWTLAVPMNIWDHYLYYGDPRTIERFYPVMAMMLNRLWELTDGDLDKFTGIGDWQAPTPLDGKRPVQPWISKMKMTNSFASVDTDIALSVGAFWVGAADATAEFSRRLGKDPAPWLKMRDDLRSRLRERFFKEGGFSSVCGDVLALAFGLVESDAEAATVAADLNRRTCHDWQGHPGLGQTVLHELAVQLGRYGYADTAKRLFLIKGYPSFWTNLEPPRTTLSPGWRAQYNRQVQQAQSRAGVWFTQGLAGIQPNREGPGFCKFTLEPEFPTDHPEASATLATAQGEITSAWKREGSSIRWSIVVPWNSTGTVKLPQFNTGKITLNGEPVVKNEFEVPAGKWEIVLQN